MHILLLDSTDVTDFFCAQVGSTCAGISWIGPVPVEVESFVILCDIFLLSKISFLLFLAIVELERFLKCSYATEIEVGALDVFVETEGGKDDAHLVVEFIKLWGFLRVYDARPLVRERS